MLFIFYETHINLIWSFNFVDPPTGTLRTGPSSDWSPPHGSPTHIVPPLHCLNSLVPQSPPHPTTTISMVDTLNCSPSHWSPFFSLVHTSSVNPSGPPSHSQPIPPPSQWFPITLAPCLIAPQISIHKPSIPLIPSLIAALPPPPRPIWLMNTFKGTFFNLRMCHQGYHCIHIYGNL